MKKLIPLFLFLLVLTGCAEAYDGPTVGKTVLASKEEHYSYSGGEVTDCCRTEYTYDIHGNQSVILEYCNEEPTAKTVLRYDGAGNPIRQTRYDVSGWFPRKIADYHYRYDDQGRMVGSALSGEPEITIIYDDEKGTRTTSSEGSTIVEYFDEKGWVTRIEYPGTDRVEEYERRADGEWIAIRTYTGGELESTLERTFDDQGRVIHQYSTKDGVTAPGSHWEYTDNREIYRDSSSESITEYNPDGTRHIRLDLDENGDIWCTTYYHYTEIQVPAEEVAP